MYNRIFAPVINEISIENRDTYEAAYLLSFLARNKTFESWEYPFYNNAKIWRKIYKLRNKGELKNLDIYIDLLGVQFGINIFELSKNPFEGVKNTEETPDLNIKIAEFSKNLY